MHRKWAAAQRTARRFEAASAAEQRVVARLLLLTEDGWRLAADRRWPGTRAANVDLLLVGPGGVYVVDVKNWYDAPHVVAGRLFAGERPRDAEAWKLLAITRIAEAAVSALGVWPLVVVPLLVFAGHPVDTTLGRIRLLGEAQVGPDLVARPPRLDPASVVAIGERLERVFPAYEDLAESAAAAPTASLSPSLTRIPTPRPLPPPPAAPGGRLDVAFDTRGFAAATLRAARGGPIERWMTYLDPAQCDLVRADWAGPARITGAAGTGKTVVGLHRAAYLAQHGAGRVLYVTSTANLPRVQRTFLATMAPVALDRVDFRGLHAWALAFLDERGAPPTDLDPGRAAAAFDRAWAETGRDGGLAGIAASPGYWRDEIGQLIKGRGIDTFAKYARSPRPGRRVRLTRAGDRAAVWRLYERYRQLLRTEQVCDFDDVLAAALREALRTPGRSVYSSVLVDEVQDLTPVGVRLLHALVGDADNGLLLLGDDQQGVYPGGFRLAEAGLSIPEERTHVLRRNYRNEPAILRAALAVVGAEARTDGFASGFESGAVHGFADGFANAEPVGAGDEDGVGGTVGSGSGSGSGSGVGAGAAGDAVIRAHHPTVAEHDAALLAALRADPGAWPDTAVLCRSRGDVAHYADVIARAGIPIRLLTEYEGLPTAGVKVGGYIPAKGLEFKHVLLPRYDLANPAGGGSGDVVRERAELARRRLYVAMVRARDTLWLGHVDPPAPIRPGTGQGQGPRTRPSPPLSPPLPRRH
ncbi:UvrD-helicase domain-containing protein [Embleya sp. AB8]|uniref:UvrD-helicase domain-containing protein n=1 Tax=Embleya sp. AB8 TaxID=3156304 RepID=UPI003C737C2F